MVIGVLQVIFQGTASNMDQLQDLLVFEVESFVVLKCGVTGSTSELLYPGIGWRLHSGIPRPPYFHFSGTINGVILAIFLLVHQKHYVYQLLNEPC